MNEDYRDILSALVALADFGPPPSGLDVHEKDRTQPEVIVQFGLPPNRIDILTGVSGLDFDSAWTHRIEEILEGVRVPVLSLSDLVENKRASGRDKDRIDLKGLEGKK